MLHYLPVLYITVILDTMPSTSYIQTQTHHLLTIWINYLFQLNNFNEMNRYLHANQYKARNSYSIIHVSLINLLYVYQHNSFVLHYVYIYHKSQSLPCFNVLNILLQCFYTSNSQFGSARENLLTIYIRFLPQQASTITRNIPIYLQVGNFDVNPHNFTNNNLHASSEAGVPLVLLSTNIAVRFTLSTRLNNLMHT